MTRGERDRDAEQGGDDKRSEVRTRVDGGHLDGHPTDLDR